LSINNSKSRTVRNIEKWSDVIAKLNLDVSKPVNYITADQIKQTSNREPRLMAKMDSLEQLPKAFRDNNLFLLPVSRRQYAIVRGVGYHQLERIKERPLVYVSSYPFPKSFADFESEQIYLNYAYCTGLLERFAQISCLNPPLQIRIDTPKFNFNVNNSNIIVDRSQIEIDAITEGLKTIITVEAKIRTPTSFSIRQIYYPFCTFFDKKKRVRNFFLCFEPKQDLYIFWEYEFNPFDSFESISLIQCKQYKVKVSNVSSIIEQFRNIQARQGIIIPQADDVTKIIQFPVKVSEGYDTAEKMMNEFNFSNRQSSYYRHTSEILGLVVSERNNRYNLTERGQQYLKLSAEKKSSFICRLLLEFPIMNEIFLDISSDQSKVIKKQNIMDLLKRKSDLTGNTLERRARTIRSWFKWIRNNLGIVEVDTYGNIRVSRQLKLD
jgi:uncharacterized protein DUF6997/uncharacterized protein DUF6996